MNKLTHKVNKDSTSVHKGRGPKPKPKRTTSRRPSKNTPNKPTKIIEKKGAQGKKRTTKNGPLKKS